MTKLSYLIVLLLFTTLTYAQGGKYGAQGQNFGVVTGTVFDAETDQPVAYATITVKDTTDTVLTGGITDESGKFTVKEIASGEVVVEVSFIGYDSQTFGPYNISPQSPSHDLGMVSLGVDNAQLDAVVVEGIGDAVRYEIDKKVYDASKIRAAEGGTAKDVLEQIPSITVDGNQNIQLRGSQNVRVLINGRPSSFSLQTLLEQIPQKNIEEVEVITNPSAKYDAEGDAGIINIILKENNIQGLTYGFNGQWGTENKWNGGANIALKTEKWNLTSSYNYNRFRDDFFRDTRRFVFSDPLSDQFSDEDRLFVREGHFIRLGVDHYFDKKNTLFLSGSINPGNNVATSNAFNSNVLSSLQNGVEGFLPIDNYTFNRFNDSDGDRFGYDLTAAFQHDFNENPRHNLLIDLSYSDSEDENMNDFITSSNSFDTFTDFDQRIDNGQNIKLSADYTNPFDGNQKLEVGYRSTLDDRNQEFNVMYNNTLDPLNTGTFDFQQDVHAGYFTFEKKANEKMGLKGGLRLEHSIVNSIAEGGQDNTYEDEYTSLFPTASASYQLSEKTQLSATFSRRINRPRGRQLNPFADRSDANNRFQGNNSLRPEFTNNYELGVNRNWETVSMDASAYHRFVNDHIRYYSELNDDGVNTITFRNVAELQVWGAESSFNISPKNAKWINIMLSGNYNYGKITELGSDDELQNDQTSVFNGRIMNNLNFGKGWGGQVSANYQSPFQYYQGPLSSMWGLNLNARKSGLLDGKASVYITARDVFNTFGLNIDITNDTQIQTVELDWPSQMMFVGFNMNFGKMKDKGKRKMQRREERGDQQPGLGF